VDRRAIHGVAARRVAAIRPVEDAMLEVELEVDRLWQTLEQHLDVAAVGWLLASRDVDTRPEDTTQLAVVRTFLRPVHVAARRIDDRTVLPVEVGALDRAILAAGHTHVRPVHVAGPGVDGDAVGQVAAGGDDRLVGAVRLHRKDAASAEVENEQTAGSAGIWFRTHDRLLAGFRAFFRNGAAHA